MSCEGTTRRGTPCKATVPAGERYCRHHTPEPVPRDPDAPPEGLDEESRLLWERARSQLEAQGTWRPTDSALLDQYVHALARARDARARADAEPFVKGSKEQLVAHPGFAIARAAEQDAHAYATSLLLTAQTRARHKLTDDPGDQDLDDTLT